MRDINKEGINEEILYSYKCTNNVFTLLRIFILSIFIYYLYIYLGKYENIIELVIGFLFGFGFMYLIYLEINNLINRGFHITKKYLITFSGSRIPIEDVMYRSTGGFGYSILQLYDKQKFIQFCFIKDNEEFKKFISTLKTISNNKNFIYDSTDGSFGFDNQNIKSKLIRGTNNGK